LTGPSGTNAPITPTTQEKTLHGQGSAEATVMAAPINIHVLRSFMRRLRYPMISP
jgi:hypothetical protein